MYHYMTPLKKKYIEVMSQFLVYILHIPHLKLLTILVTFTSFSLMICSIQVHTGNSYQMCMTIILKDVLCANFSNICSFLEGLMNDSCTIFQGY